MFQVVIVAPAGFGLNIFEVFTHSVPLLIDESLSPDGFDDAHEWRRPTHSYSVVLVSVHVVRGMSRAWL